MMRKYLLAIIIGAAMVFGYIYLHIVGSSKLEGVDKFEGIGAADQTITNKNDARKESFIAAIANALEDFATSQENFKTSKELSVKNALPITTLVEVKIGKNIYLKANTTVDRAVVTKQETILRVPGFLFLKKPQEFIIKNALLVSPRAKDISLRQVKSILSKNKISIENTEYTSDNGCIVTLSIPKSVKVKKLK